MCGIYVTLVIFLSPCVQMQEASVQGGQQSGKALPPPHALALYQQQITMAHGESSQEVKQQQQQQQFPGQLGKQQPYTPQADRDREALHSGSPRVRPRSPSAGEKDGMHTSIATETCLIAWKLYLPAKVANTEILHSFRFSAWILFIIVLHDLSVTRLQGVQLGVLWKQD